MPRTLALLPALLALTLSACATREYDVVKPPSYAADLYPLSQTKGGVTVAIDQIGQPQRARRFFGTDLVDKGIFPVDIVVSNGSASRVQVDPSDIVLTHGEEIIDPVPLETVASAATGGSSSGFSGDAKVMRSFEGSAFRSSVLLPNQTYRGVVFFAPPKNKKSDEDWFFKEWNIYPQSEGRLRVGATLLDTGERVRFGPFVVKLPGYGD